MRLGCVSNPSRYRHLETKAHRCPCFHLAYKEGRLSLTIGDKKDSWSISDEIQNMNEWVSEWNDCMYQSGSTSAVLLAQHSTRCLLSIVLVNKIGVSFSILDQKRPSSYDSHLELLTSAILSRNNTLQLHFLSPWSIVIMLANTYNRQLYDNKKCIQFEHKLPFCPHHF